MTTVSFGQRLRCERCGHEWNARSERKPVQCPRCKSTRWDTRRYRYEVPAGRKVRSVRELKAFGMWADRPETDEELLGQLRSGWRDAEPE